MQTIEVVVQTSDPIAREGLCCVLRSVPGVRLLPESERSQAQVLVVLEDHVDEDVVATMREARAQASRENAPHCVVITDDFHESQLIAAVECGVTSILARRDAVRERIAEAVLNAGDGTAHLPPSLQGALLAQVERLRRDVLQPNGLTLSGLAERERDVLKLVAEGLGTEEIARKLSYSERTVKNVLYSVMSRLNLNNRTHAVAYALRAGAI